MENNLFITNTNFKHHIRRLYTWQSPCGQYRNQIDYILVRKRWKSSVKDIKTYPGMDCGSDHNALVAEICLKLKKSKKLIPKTKLNTEALDQYRLEVNKAIEDMRLEENETDNVEELWQKFKNAVLLSLKKTPRIDRPKKPWISHYTWELIKKREQIKIRGIREDRQLTEYNELCRMINQSLRKEKDNL